MKPLRQFERITRIVGIALVIMTAIGHPVANTNPKMVMPDKHGQPRISVLTLGRGLMRSLHLRAADIAQSVVRLAFPCFQAPNFPWLWKPLPFKPIWEAQK